MRQNQLRKMALRRKQFGLTLIELMIVTVVIGTLASLAIPAYRGYAQRAQRTEGKSALLQVQTNQERFYLQNNTYATTFTQLGNPSGMSENGVYTLSFIGPAPNTIQYTVQAVPTVGGGLNGVNQTTDLDCQVFTLNSQGVRTATPNVAGACW